MVATPLVQLPCCTASHTAWTAQAFYLGRLSQWSTVVRAVDLSRFVCKTNWEGSSSPLKGGKPEEVLSHPVPLCTWCILFSSASDSLETVLSVRHICWDSFPVSVASVTLYGTLHATSTATICQYIPYHSDKFTVYVAPTTSRDTQ